jgi:hypothetical protein
MEIAALQALRPYNCKVDLTVYKLKLYSDIKGMSMLIKRSAFCVIFLAVLLASASADTVMLFSEAPTGKGNLQDSVIYVEDGIMEVFFGAGHIIFNGGFQEYDQEGDDDAAEQTFDDVPSFRVAKSGGANYILQVRLQFTADEEDTLPEKAQYSFFELSSEKKLADGVVLLSEAGDREKLEVVEIIRRMGREVGSQALQEM